MNKDTIYYLKKNQKLLITSKKANSKAVINFIDGNNIVHGHYLDKYETIFNCCEHEFSEIFSSEPS